MRTPLLAGLLAVVLPACLTGEISDVGGGGDDQGMGSGSGSGDGSGTENPIPRVTASIDKTAVMTELGKTEMVTVNLTSEDGFAGDVAIAARLVDATAAALPNITVQGPELVSLSANATGSAAFQIQVPMNATGSDLAGTLEIDLTSSAGMQNLTSALMIKAIYTVDYAAGTGPTVAKHMNAGAPNLVVKRGAILRFHNSDTDTHIIHGGDVFPHENTQTGGAPGRDYDVETIAIPPGSTGTLGCHTHGASTYSTYRVE